MKRTILRFDAGLTRWISATFGQRPHRFFELLTALGDPLTIGIITVCIIGYGMYVADLALIMSGASIPITVLIGALLKLLFERARPATEYALNMKLQTFSFPSGHSSGSTITYGILAWLVLTAVAAPWGVLISIFVALLPFGVGVSRVYLGAHFPSDVIAGWLLGGISLALVLSVVRPMV